MSKKVKRVHVNWWKVLNGLDNPEIFSYFGKLVCKLKPHIKRGHHMSMNRCAYYALKHYYSTTTVDELCRKLGI